MQVSQRYKILTILALVVLILLVDHLGFLEGTNHHLYDLSFRLRGARPFSKDILLVEINEETLKKFGRWPLRRVHYASLLERLKQAEVVILNITLSEKTEDDFLLEKSIERHGRVILPIYIDHQMNLVSPAPTLRSHCTGHVHLEAGLDGIVREVYHTLVHQKEVIPSISSVAYEMARRTSFQRMSPPSSDKSGEDILQMDRMQINYCGPPGTCEKIFFPDVLNGVYSPAFFKGKIVLVGVVAMGLGDQFLTPFSQHRNYMPGIEVQANILNTLLANNSIRVTSPWILWSLVLLVSLLSFLFFLKMTEKKAAVFGLVMLIGMTLILYVLFSVHNLWLRPAVFYVTIAAGFLATYVMKLEDAAKNLGQAYAEVLPQLRWKRKTEKAKEKGDRLSGIFTSGGLQSKVRMLSDVSYQLIFEKELTDHALLNHLHAVLLFGPDGKNLIVNERAVAYCEANSLDWTTAEGFIKGIGPYSLDENSFGVLNLQQGHVTSMISLPLPQKTYLKIDASAIDGLEGKYLFFTLSDVTQIKELEILKEHLLSQKEAEEALRESKSRYDELVQRIPVGVFALRIRADRSMVFEYVSPQLCQILDLDEDTLLCDANLAFTIIDHEDRENFFHTTREVAVSLKPLRWDGRFVIRNETRWLRIESDPTQLPGGDSLWNGVIGDITERKRGEEALKKALDEIKKLKEQLEAENIYLREEIELKDGLTDIVGSSNPIKYVMYRIQQVARTKTTVLLTGETGTGKGLFASALHEASDRRDKPFVNVNCAGLPPNLIESELFGREKGAFTGSTARQIGRFELANGGTIFLDEIGELPLDLQAKLLKVIEEGEFERLGSPHPVKVDVRIVASTNRHLEEEMKKDRFRKDLFYRLNVFPITIPPLRQRKEDIPPLVKFYADKFSKRHGKRLEKIPKDTMRALKNYSWPGNVRELINVIERAVIVSDSPELRLAEKIDAISFANEEEATKADDAVGAKDLSAVEREHILRILHETGWKIEGDKGAAKLLRMNPSTMRARMRKLGIKRPGTHERPS